MNNQAPPAQAGHGSRSSPGRRQLSTANGPRTTGRPGAWASPPGAGAPRRASTGSASRGCATRSSAGPGSAWPPGAHSPPLARGHWRSPGSPGSSPPVTRRRTVRARSPGRSWRTTCPGCSPRDTQPRTRALSLSMIRVFFEACHRHGWLPGLAASATIYVEELPFHHDEIARFIPEYVMAQLESDEAIAKIPHLTTRHLIVVMIETGLRGGDACTLPFNPVLTDSSGWPCLRFEAVKVRAEQLIPLSAKAAAAIAAQQDHVRERWPAGSPWLFPGTASNQDGSKPYSHSAFSQQLRRWQRAIGLRDEAGQPVTVTGHQFRHTLGTRLINSGVPQHVVQKLLGHASPHMTSHYAKVHDTTIREAFDRYQAQRINITGQRIGYDPDAPTASAEWVKHNLNRVRDSLPNGYCARPAQQDCPHPNACLTCPDFQTTPVFLQIHRRQAATNRRLIAQADANSQQRLAENLRRVQASLDQIIPALEALKSDGPGDDPR